MSLPAEWPAEVEELLHRREEHRARKEYARSDALRDQIEALGYAVLDLPGGTVVRPVPPPVRPTVSSSKEVPSRLEEPAGWDFSVVLLAHNNRDEIERAVASILRHSGDHRVEIALLDNASRDGTADYIEELSQGHPEVVAIFAAKELGEAAGRNCGLRASTGRIIVWMGSNVELSGDVFTPLAATLEDPRVGVTGGWGLSSSDLRHFEASPGPEVDAMEAYLFAFRRSQLREVGFLDEKFKFYRNLDLDFSFAFRDKGYRIVITPNLPARLHEHRVWASLSEEERARLSKRNFYRFLDKWGQRYDLLLSGPPQPHHHEHA
ncbi:MAG: glycosyltransferase [Chloroflexi bacterium]|nr:glycosyltransferase [Chloroflexota bacterium]